VAAAHRSSLSTSPGEVAGDRPRPFHEPHLAGGQVAEERKWCPRPQSSRLLLRAHPAILLL